MIAGKLESVILYASDFAASKAFYAETLGLPIMYEDEIVVVLGAERYGHLVVHRDDRGHDERGVFPAGAGTGGAAIRLTVDDPDACEREARELGVPVVWEAQDAMWGRFVILADPDGRPVVLAKMREMR